MWTLVILTLAFSLPAHLLAHRSTREAEDRLVVYPHRIDHRGHLYPQSLQFRRKEQAAWYGKTRYRLEGANGTTWILELQPLHQLPQLRAGLSPKLKTKTLTQAGCYYKGRILGFSFSSVKVSLCGGMTGDIHLSHEDFVIHPISSQKKGLLHHLSLLRHPDPHRAWRPLHVQNINFCDVTEESHHHHVQQKQPQSYSNSSIPLIRKRRSESRERHLEVLVVADSKMAAYHGQNLNHYILTLMSTVALIYKDPSIGNNINIAVVDILVLNETSDAEVIHHIAPITLRNFCRWQHRHNKADDRDPGHHDTAVLITREDLCRYPGACDTLGLAQSGMVCDPESSCAIVEDNGLSAAFTIAHEIGHVMSIPHDDDTKCSRFQSKKKRLHVMARMLDYNSHPWSWSECSRSYLTTFFDVGYGRCLMDPPGRNRLLLDDEFQQPPGQLYSQDRQCELVFSRNSRICPYMPECTRLWCTMDDPAQSGCRTQHMPWADGTQCGEGKRCYQGECMRYRPAHLTPMDGEWGQWASYGGCSRTCGGGVQQRLRECDSPKPSNGGRYCIGVRVQFKSCNSQECPAGSGDFRAQQCAEFNNRDINLPGLPRTAQWVPQYTGIAHAEKCKLYCKMNESSSYYVLREKVIDGTPCDYGSFDICVNGKCETAGCDHVLQSNTALDRCGVCGGSNNTCKEIKGKFNKKVDYGYHNVIMIPKGASNIRIQQSSADGNIDDNYIALRERNTKGKYLLNGGFMISMFPKTIEYYGVTIDYSGSHLASEQLNCSEAIPEDLLVEVLVVGQLQAPNISFSYTVPLSNEDVYTWKLATQYSECSRLCNGISSLRPICIRLSDQSPVNDNHCADIQKPTSLKARKCNEHCNLMWKDVGKNKCSVECGSGTIHKIIKCMKEEISTKNSHAVPEEHCFHLGEKPSSHEKCSGSCFNSLWVYSDWSECSVSCGQGLQHRTVKCMSSDNVNQPYSNCDSSSKVLTKVCNQGACPHWKFGNWTGCSVTCGAGVRERPYWCEHEKKIVDVRYCKESEIPVTKEACHLGDCVSWKVGDWEKCHGKCGNGSSSRAVYCQNSNLKVDDAFCSHLDRPSSTKTCSTNIPCNDLYIKKNNTLRHRSKNWKVPNQAMSDTNSIPEFNRAVWKEGKWSKCSNVCGEGIRRRTVTCHDVNDDSRLALSYCDSKRKPKTSEKCSDTDCSHWEVGEWLECSVSCGNGIKRRQVVCYNFNGKTRERSSDCDIRKKPSETYECNHGPCPDWVVGDWSECSVSCGEGSQHRLVQCYNDNEEQISESFCSIAKKPAEKMSCFTRNCLEAKRVYDWIKGPWSQCSSSCGDGIQYRNVICLNEIGHEEYEHLCPHPKPSLNQSCNLGQCPTWSWSEWSECPKNCGISEQYRQPQCIRNEVIVDEKNCYESKPFVDKRPCKVLPECTYTWRHGLWSQCFASCGKTFKIREVFCVDSDNHRVSENLCLSRSKPPKKKKRCNLKPCPYTWITSEWSECSKSCNEGVRKRKVSCHAVNEYGWMHPNEIKMNAKSYCGLRQPKDSEVCNYGNCSDGFVWKPEEWQPCKGSCKNAKQKRKIRCYSSAGKKVPNRFCISTQKPRKKRKCSSSNCPPQSCKEIQHSQQKQKNGNYELEIKGKTVTVYCHGMDTAMPQEFINLRDRNFAVIYSTSLANNFRSDTSDRCTANVSQSCDCSRTDFGYTQFSKVALNVTGLKIINDDYTFSITPLGKPVPFGTAGDCYRNSQCPQGIFFISLLGTDFKISSEVSWVSKRRHGRITLHRTMNGQYVKGKCGGFCDTCLPDPERGLIVDVS